MLPCSTNISLFSTSCPNPYVRNEPIQEATEPTTATKIPAMKLTALLSLSIRQTTLPAIIDPKIPNQQTICAYPLIFPPMLSNIKQPPFQILKNAQPKFCTKKRPASLQSYFSIRIQVFQAFTKKQGCSALTAVARFVPGSGVRTLFPVHPDSEKPAPKGAGLLYL